jgi:hypothetical protein
VRRR